MSKNFQKIKKIRLKLNKKKCTIGTWMQIPSPDVAEILSSCDFDWVTVDMEHGSFSISQLPNIFRAIELGSSVPLVRLPNSDITTIRQVLDCGAAGIIIPNIEDQHQLEKCIENCNWPPKGKRGVGFSRANLFGKNFESYKKNLIKPLVIAIIESKKGYDNLDRILNVKNLDCIFIGPYDLSASLNVLGKFNNNIFKNVIKNIIKKCKSHNVPCGIHVVEPNVINLKKASKNFQFIAYSIDAQFIINGTKFISKINK